MCVDLLISFFLPLFQLIKLPIFAHLPRINLFEKRRVSLGASFDKLLRHLCVWSERWGEVFGIFFGICFFLYFAHDFHLKFFFLYNLLVSFMNRQRGLFSITFLLFIDDLLRFLIKFNMLFSMIKLLLTFLNGFELTMFKIQRLLVQSIHYLATFLATASTFLTKPLQRLSMK